MQFNVANKMTNYAKCPFCNYDIEIKVNSQKGSKIDLWLKQPTFNTRYNLLITEFVWYLFDKEIGKENDKIFKYDKETETFTFNLYYYRGEWKQYWIGKFKFGLGRQIEIVEENVKNR